MQKTENGTILEGPVGMGARMRDIRREEGMNQEELAGALGLAQQTVSAWERDQCLISVRTLWAFCALTGVSADTVLGLPDKLYSCCDGEDDEDDVETGPYCCPTGDCRHNVPAGVCALGGVCVYQKRGA